MVEFFLVLWFNFYLVFMWQRSHVGSPVNEWADVEAERFVGSEPREVITEVPSYQSMRVGWADRDPHAWLMARAAGAVHECLRACSEGTQFWDEGCCVVPEFGLEEERLRRAALAERCFWL